MSRRWPLLGYPAFVRFWAADAISMAGTSITTVALPAIAVFTLGASDTEVGLINAARWLPYLLLGLLAGVFVDRHRRKPILVTADLARGAILALIPLFAALDVLSLPLLIAVVLVFGALSLGYDAAHQSYPPVLVPTALLTPAWSRLEQTNAVATTGGPAVAGFLVQLISAPLAILLDALSYLISGLLLLTVRPLVPEVAPGKDIPRDLRQEIRAGLAWVYRNPVTTPLAVTGHIWFVFQGIIATAYTVFAYRALGLSVAAVGVTLAIGGVGSVIGATASGWVGRRMGVGPAIVFCRWITPFGYLLIPLAGDNALGFVMLCLSQFAFGLSIGIDSPIEMGYRQSVTPSGLLGRMHATLRSVNRASLTVGLVLGGLLAEHLGRREALWIGVAGMVLQAVLLHRSAFRHARLSDAD